jgi:MOSC domain-containing protein YiiM
MDERKPEPLKALLFKRPQAGRLAWIGLRGRRGQPVTSVDGAELIADMGIAGDHRSVRGGGKRQVSLIQAEHLPVIATLVGREQLEPGLLRRNLLVAGLNLLALRSARFRVGACILEGAGSCEPCSKMELALGEGGYNAMRGHGGILARVIEGGRIYLGDEVDFA